MASGVFGLLDAAIGLWMLVALATPVDVVPRTGLSVVGTAAMVAMSAIWFRRVFERDDALAEVVSVQGGRVWPGPASIR